MKKKVGRISLLLPEDLKKRLIQKAEREQRTLSLMIRAILQEAVK